MFDKIKDLLGGHHDDLGSLPLGGLEKYLDGVSYPVGVDDLVIALKNNGAPDQVTALVQKVAQGGKSSFASQDELVETLTNQAKSQI